MNLSPQDRDLIIRTVIGEAGNQPDEGKAAVAHVIFNRTRAGEWGKTPTEVVLAPSQFEPWQTRAKDLLSIQPDAPEYQAVGKIVDAAHKGEMPDPTQGATYFLQPDIVRQRRGGTLPGWATGPSMKIGVHQFFYGGKGGPQMAQAKTDGTVSDADVDETAKLLGLTVKTSPKGGASKVDGLQAGENASGVTPDEVAETLRTLGINTKPTPPASQAGSDVTPGGNGQPARITVRPRPPAIQTSLGYQNQLVQGMPIISPLFDRAVAATGALIQPWTAKDAAPSFSERYAANLKDIRQENKQFAEERPVGSTVANLTGGAMALGPLASTRIGGLLLGTRGPNLGSRIITGGVGGAGINAADAALRGESPVSGGTIGLIGGAAGPLIGEAVRGGTSWFANNVLPRTGPLRDLPSNAVRKLTEAYSGETPVSMAESRTRMGPAGFVGDINPAFTDIAGGIADIPGPGKAVVRGAYEGRARGQPQRIEKALTKAMGPSTNVEHFKDFLAETRKAAADPLYKAWRSTEVHPTDKIKELLPRLEKAGAFDMAEELSAISGEPINRTFFTGGATKAFPTTQSWDYVKRGLDRRIDQAYRAGDKTLGRELIKLKGEMIEEIGKTPAGKIWNQARAEFAERSALIDQVDAGRDTFLGGRSGLSVDELAEEVKHLKGPELMARIVGARSAADEAMGATLRGDSTLRNKLLAPNNKKKMELLLGKDKADELLRTMEQEKYLMEQTANVVGNINTGASAPMRSARREALQLPPVRPWDFDMTRPGTWLPPSMREQFTPHGFINAWRGQAGAESANKLAPLMTTQASDASFNQLMRAIRREAAVRDAVAQRWAPRATGISGLISGPATTTARRQYLPAD